MESIEKGIEASDLASLLHRFEEAVTPPATPTPTCTKNQPVSGSQTLLTVISKAPSSGASKPAVTRAQLQVKPKPVYSSNKPGISLLPFTLPHNSRTVAPLVKPPNIIIRASVPPLQPQALVSTSNTYAGTAFKLVPANQVGAPLLLVKPVNQAAVGKLPKKQIAVTTASRAIKRSASVISLSTASQPSVTSTSSSLLQSMLLDKNACIIPKKGQVKRAGLNLNSVVKAVSSSAVVGISTTVSSLSVPTKVTERPLQSAVSNQIILPGLSQSLPSSPTSSKSACLTVKEADHDYCFNQSQVDHQFQNSQSANKLSQVSIQEKTISVSKEEDHRAAVSAEEARTVSSLDAELLQDLEYLDKLGPVSPPLVGQTSEGVLEDGEVIVDEDGNDFFPQLVPSVLNQSQDILDQNPQGSMPYQNGVGTVVAFDLNGEEPMSGRRKGRRYRRHTELNTSPIREDKTDFFDKIPAFYTALSIPTKPTKMSVFASATKSLGSTDHLEPDNKVIEDVDPGLYDKVPAHRRCFTNTTREIGMKSIDLPEEQNLQPAASSSFQPMSSSLLSSSSTELNPEGSTPPRCSRPRSRRKTRSRHLSSCSGSSDHQSHPVPRLASRSHSGSRPSRERLRSCSRSHSRSGSASSRSCSTCSSYSSGSSCGSSCSGCSRSRSRSCSTCCSSDSSRSRSRSPQVKRDWQQRAKRAELSPRGRHHHGSRNSHRWSRSISPTERAGWRSRSRSQRRRTHSRSSFVDEKAAQKKKAREEEKVKAMEERRIVYVGKIPESYTKRQLHQRFQCFGEIKEVKLNFREHGDNYGFVTFAYACDAIAAKEKGNNIEGVPKFDLCFGGRRRFCPDQYADLDGNREIEEEYAPMPQSMSGELDYAALLKQHSSQQRRGGKL